jgi:ATP-binding cassette subfamily F protein 3
MDADLAANYEKTAADSKFFDSYKSKKKSLEEWMGKWETVSEELDGLH